MINEKDRSVKLQAHGCLDANAKKGRAKEEMVFCQFYSTYYCWMFQPDYGRKIRGIQIGK